MTEEEQIQMAVVQHLQLRAKPGVLWWHTPNGGKRHIAEAKKLKAMGTRAGVADLLFFDRGQFFSLELKAEKGRETDTQIEWKQGVRDAGGEAFTAYGLDEALSAIKSWGIIT